MSVRHFLTLLDLSSDELETANGTRHRAKTVAA